MLISLTVVGHLEDGWYLFKGDRWWFYKAVYDILVFQVLYVYMFAIVAFSVFACVLVVMVVFVFFSSFNVFFIKK